MRWMAILIVLFCVSCSQMQSSSDAAEDEERKLKTALINVRLSAIYMQQGNVDWAQRTILNAERRAPDSPYVQAGMAFFLAGTGEIERAEQYYQLALNHEQPMPEVMNNYGIFLCDQKRHKAAIDYFVRASKVAGYTQPADALANAAYCAMSYNDRASAIKFFNQALQRNPQKHELLYDLSKLYYQQADWNKAKTYLKRYLIYHKPDAKMLEYSRSLEQKSVTPAKMSLQMAVQSK